jgi:hypothetical protein
LERPAETPRRKGGEFVIGLLIVGFFGAVFVIYTADRVLAARTRARRLRKISDRLAAAAQRSERQLEQRQAAAAASAALTSVMPAIKRPPLSLPDMRHSVPRPRTGCDRPGQQDHGSAHPARRTAHTGDHPACPATERTGRSTGEHAARPGSEHRACSGEHRAGPAGPAGRAARR